MYVCTFFFSAVFMLHRLRAVCEWLAKCIPLKTSNLIPIGLPAAYSPLSSLSSAISPSLHRIISYLCLCSEAAPSLNITRNQDSFSLRIHIPRRVIVAGEQSAYQSKVVVISYREVLNAMCDMAGPPEHIPISFVDSCRAFNFDVVQMGFEKWENGSSALKW